MGLGDPRPKTKGSRSVALERSKLGHYYLHIFFLELSNSDSRVNRDFALFTIFPFKSRIIVVVVVVVVIDAKRKDILPRIELKKSIFSPSE